MQSLPDSLNGVTLPEGEGGRRTAPPEHPVTSESEQANHASHPQIHPGARRACELALAFVLGICAVMTAQAGWKLLRSPVPAQQRMAGIDVNAADEGTLRQLPGVGPHLAARIVSHREKNGPFQTVDELRAVQGIGPATLERLRMVVMVGKGAPEEKQAPPVVQPLRSGPKVLPKEPLDLNTATLEQLITLPGIGPATAEKILEDRQQRGDFESVNDLTRIKGIKGKTLEKLLPYVTVKRREAGA